MSHHGILVKALGNDPSVKENVKEVEEKIRAVLEDTLRCSTCGRSVKNVNWDYVGDIEHVTSKHLKEEGIDSYEALEQKHIANRQTSLERLKENLQREVQQLVTLALMPLEKAPEYMGLDDMGLDDINNKKAQQHTRELDLPPIYGIRAKEILGDPSKIHEMPQTEEALAHFITEIMADAADCGLNMTAYYQRAIEDLKETIEFGDADDHSYTLHSTKNNFADFTGDTDGEHTYYFWCDRHF